jgi:TRAP-type mannitol/chloroaromatic compound transport system substrate-binding protein
MTIRDYSNSELRDTYERANKRVEELSKRERSLLDTAENITNDMYKKAVEGKASDTDEYIMEEFFNMYRLCREVLAEWTQERDRLLAEILQRIGFHSSNARELLSDADIRKYRVK